MKGNSFPCVFLGERERKRDKRMGDVLLVEPLHGGAFLCGAIEDLYADLLTRLAAGGDVDAEGTAHDLMVIAEAELKDSPSA